MKIELNVLEYRELLSKSVSLDQIKNIINNDNISKDDKLNEIIRQLEIPEEIISEYKDITYK